MNKNKFNIVPITILSVGLIITGLILSSEKKLLPENAQALSMSSGYTAEHIGGKTKGTGDTVCCNGIVLDFESQEPGNPWILDGEAIYTPGISRSYQEYNEFDEGYCTAGKLFPFICLDPAEECYSGEIMPGILTIGTSPAQCTQNSAGMSLIDNEGFNSVPSGYLAQSSGFGGSSLPGGSGATNPLDSLLNNLPKDPSLRDDRLTQFFVENNITGTGVLLYKDENQDCEEEDEKDEDDEEKDDSDKDEDCETDEEHNEKYWGENHDFLASVFGQGSGPNGAFVPEDFQAGGAVDPLVQLGIVKKKEKEQE